MKYKSCNTLSLVIAVLATACSQSDWERLQMSPNSPVTYVAKNDDGEGFAVREGLFVASTDKLASILDSGTSYPFELYLSGDGYVTIYKGKTPEWYNPHGILLVPSLPEIFSLNPKLRGDFINADKMTVVISSQRESTLISFTVKTKGAQHIVDSERWKR